MRDKAQLLGQARNLAPYDALVDEFSPGLTSGEIDAMFKALARRLPGLIREVLARQEQRPVLPIVGKFTAGKQRALALEIMKAVGFPFDRGRLDESEHPFTEGVPGDVRVTTRFDTTEPFSGLLGVFVYIVFASNVTVAYAAANCAGVSTGFGKTTSKDVP